MEYLNIDIKQYNLINSIYSIPNIIFPFFAGMISDKLGLRISILGFTLIMFLGIIIEYFATIQKSYIFVLIGVSIYGIGSESMSIIGCSFLSAWFFGKELSLSLGIYVTASYLGTVTANWTLPPLANIYDSITLPYLICVTVTFIALVCMIIMCRIDKKAQDIEFQIKLNNKQKLQQEQKNTPKAIINSTNEIVNFGIQDKEGTLNFSEFRVKSGIEGTEIEDNLTQDNSKYSETQEQINNNINNNQNQNKNQEENHEDAHEMHFSDITKLKNVQFWLINFIFCFVAAAFFPYLNNLNSILQEFYGQGPIQSGRILSVLTVEIAIFTTPLAFLTDKIGQKTYFYILSSFFLTCAFISHLIIPTCPDSSCSYFYIPIILVGISFSMLSAVAFASVPLIIRPKLLGTAFGLQDCLEQFGMAVSPIFVGHIMDYELQAGNYIFLYIYFLILAIIALVFSIWLHVYDQKKGGKLNKITQNENTHQPEEQKSLIQNQNQM
ncbi:Major facilitator superfamily domain, general substrate transporter [Pseudocohnilembus persalinus]|uniref:Lysosomal dipeptide transporter MFSD1 n=1 Tax=Pseudocohnilembus persalinus TaxID=266149 RepID=A0A0V0QX16_PSEPJ|nr:Major facilitator superfamily domain, general substrate transporter [Pseudocohnilembus persalinus]|eukprot:KRX06602.1 Major facilitator superfamily domain, general substrate transporter [Pseudocohnilembus persalinus]